MFSSSPSETHLHAMRRSALLSMKRYNAQNLSRSVQSMRAGACLDVNQLPSSAESEGELTKEGASPFIFSIPHNTHASAIGQSCTSSDEKARPTHATQVSCFQRERTYEDVLTRARSYEEGAMIARKKQRLSKEQSAVLEERFKEHCTLNSKQKIALAKQLNLELRQVEVWFQNRRARTKLKQTQVECEVLKRCCKVLCEENRRLRQEICELRALRVGVIRDGFQTPVLGTTLTMGTSCRCLAPQLIIGYATSATSISSFNQPFGTDQKSSQPSPTFS